MRARSLPAALGWRVLASSAKHTCMECGLQSNRHDTPTDGASLWLLHVFAYGTRVESACRRNHANQPRLVKQACGTPWRWTQRCLLILAWDTRVEIACRHHHSNTCNVICNLTTMKLRLMLEAVLNRSRWQALSTRVQQAENEHAP